YLIGRRQKNPGLGSRLSDVLSITLVVAFVIARLVFVAIWFPLYLASPWSIVDIRDSGFTAWAGVLAAICILFWRGWRQPTIRKPLMLALAAGTFTWAAMFTTHHFTQSTPSALPTVALTTLAGEQSELAKLANGKAMVVNLWASWCPPCHREMPVLSTLQTQQTAIAVVFVNQGEDVTTVQRYLQESQLNLSNVVLDRSGNLGKTVGSVALPTTLFYDKNGLLVTTHLGELSTASLANKLKQIDTKK
ncbi:MAG: TlpA family protein disulfide reductase, partial [Glaciimonas sp.]|nr:TlpA family protein disulfide reductase [Glaciimonas sp.]